MKKCHFVDFAAHYQKGFRNHVVEIHEVPALVDQAQRYNCFSTYFFYTDDIFAYANTHPQDGHPSISGYHGKTWAPFFPLDLDDLDLEKSLEAARVLAVTFIKNWQVPPQGCHFYFSGAKGFHVLLDIRLFGNVFPTQHLHQIFSTLRETLIYEIPELNHSVIDLSIKDPVRLLRLPNTINAKSNLYKIPLSEEEILTGSVPSILEKARQMRLLPFTDETGLISKVQVETHSKLEKIFNHVRRLIRRHTQKPFVYQLIPRHGEEPAQFLCPGFMKMWDGPIEPGERNNCAIRLLSEFRLNGLGEAKSRELIYLWNGRQMQGLSERELEHTLHSAYAHPFPYRYSFRDPILQGFCPYQDMEQCSEWHRRKNLKNGEKKSA